jgi:hypothetical protein
LETARLGQLPLQAGRPFLRLLPCPALGSDDLGATTRAPGSRRLVDYFIFLPLFPFLPIAIGIPVTGFIGIGLPIFIDFFGGIFRAKDFLLGYVNRIGDLAACACHSLSSGCVPPLVADCDRPLVYWLCRYI